MFFIIDCCRAVTCRQAITAAAWASRVLASFAVKVRLFVDNILFIMNLHLLFSGVLCFEKAHKAKTVASRHGGGYLVRCV